MEIKRYARINTAPCFEPMETADGEFVKYQDHMREMEELRISLDEIRASQFKRHETYYYAEVAKVNELRKKNNQLACAIAILSFLLLAVLI